MSSDRGSNERPEHPREATEWIVSYAYNASDSKLPRVLLVGDSICNGYSAPTRDALAGSAYLAFFATSKCVTDKSYLRALEFFVDEYEFSFIHFNNGLHSLLTPLEEWGPALKDAVSLLKRKASRARLCWASSTPLADPALTEKAKALNGVAVAIMKEEGIPINDLFALMDPLDRKAHWCDTYHFREEAKAMQAKAVAACALSALGAGKATEEEAKAALLSAKSKTGPDGSI